MFNVVGAERHLKNGLEKNATKIVSNIGITVYVGENVHETVLQHCSVITLLYDVDDSYDLVSK